MIYKQARPDTEFVFVAKYSQQKKKKQTKLKYSPPVRPRVPPALARLPLIKYRSQSWNVYHNIIRVGQMH